MLIHLTIDYTVFLFNIKTHFLIITYITKYESILYDQRYHQYHGHSIVYYISVCILRESDGVVDGGHYPIQSTLEAPPLIVPDFTLSSLSSSLIHVTSNGTITDVRTVHV